MTSVTDDLSSLYPVGGDGMSLRQGTISAWDADTGANTVTVGGSTLTNLPVMVAESAALVAGDVVGVLSAGDRMCILGKIRTPGDAGTVPTWTIDITALNDVTIPAVQAAVVTAQGTADTAVTDAAAAQSTATDAATDAAQAALDAAAAEAAAAQAAADAAAAAAATAALQADLDTAEADVAAVVADVATLNNTTLPALDADLASAQADITAAQGDITAAQGQITTAQGQITTLTGTTIPALDADITAAQSDIATLTGTTIPALDADLTTAQGQITTLTGTTLPALQTQVNGILPIGTTDISSGAITTPLIAANAITATEIAAGAITTGKIAVGTVTANELAAGAVTAIKIAADTITASQIAANAVTATELNAGAVTTAKIAAGAVTATEISSGAVTAIKIAADTITAAQIAASAITASELAANAVTAGKIAAGTIVAADISAGAITTAKIAADAVTANEIAAGTITATELAAGAITAAKIQAGAIDGQVITGAVIRTAASGQRVVINDVTSPNIIDFHTGDGAETASGRVSGESVSPGVSILNLVSPRLGATTSGISLRATTVSGGAEAAIEADLITLTGPVVTTDPIYRAGELTWKNPTLLNSWVNTGGTSPTAQYHLYPDGDVGLRGVLVNTVVGAGVASVMFTLPPGYRPPKGISWLAWTNTGAAIRLQVGANGDVFHTTTAASKANIEITGRFSTLT